MRSPRAGTSSGGWRPDAYGNALTCAVRSYQLACAPVNELQTRVVSRSPVASLAQNVLRLLKLRQPTRTAAQGRPLAGTFPVTDDHVCRYRALQGCRDPREGEVKQLVGAQHSTAQHGVAWHGTVRCYTAPQVLLIGSSAGVDEVQQLANAHMTSAHSTAWCGITQSGSCC